MSYPERIWWPWSPVYPKAEGPGRPPVGVERMLRLHCLQQWFNLSDPTVEEALYDSCALRQFVGNELGRELVPDETTICKFRHPLGAHRWANSSLHGSGRIWRSRAWR